MKSGGLLHDLPALASQSITDALPTREVGNRYMHDCLIVHACSTS
jgi:hypothetical protein